MQHTPNPPMNCHSIVLSSKYNCYFFAIYLHNNVKTGIALILQDS